MLDEVKRTLGQTADHTVADGGYSSGQELLKAEDANYEVLVNLGEGGNPMRNGKAITAPTSPMMLPGMSVSALKAAIDGSRGLNGTGVGMWSRSTVAMMAGNVRTASVTRDARSRMIEVAPYHQALVRQREVQKDDRLMRLLKKRKSIVEMVFAAVKQRMGFRRWTVRGMAEVRTQQAIYAQPSTSARCTGMAEPGVLPFNKPELRRSLLGYCSVGCSASLGRLRQPPCRAPT